MPTPAARATSSSGTSTPCSANCSAATPSRRSRLRCASLRIGRSPDPAGTAGRVGTAVPTCAIAVLPHTSSQDLTCQTEGASVLFRRNLPVRLELYPWSSVHVDSDRLPSPPRPRRHPRVPADGRPRRHHRQRRPPQDPDRARVQHLEPLV